MCVFLFSTFIRVLFFLFLFFVVFLVLLANINLLSLTGLVVFRVSLLFKCFVVVLHRWCRLHLGPLGWCVRVVRFDSQLITRLIAGIGVVLYEVVFQLLSN